jgi:hypothetical protein
MLSHFSGAFCDWGYLCLVPDIRSRNEFITVGYHSTSHPSLEKHSLIADIKYANLF